MKLTKQQKRAIVLLAIALVALMVDRLFLGGGNAPAAATASPYQDSVESAPSPVEQTTAPVVPPEEDTKPPTVRLIGRLDTLWSEKGLEIDQARDVFSLPESWLADVFPAKPVDVPPPKQDAVTVFVTNHQLRAVVISDQTRCVNVNDHVLRLGEELDGFKLVAIEEGSATFEAGDKQAVLKLTRDR